MFENLTNKLSGIFDKLRGKGALSEADVTAAMREVRIALLEADVALPVVKDLIAAIQEEAVGQEVLKSVTPGQMVIKIVNDHLVKMLGEETETLNLSDTPPVVIMMVGLQGSGKTTTTAKLARKLKGENKRVLMASLDIYRPAAMQQLAVLGEQIEVDTLQIVPGQRPVDIANRAVAKASMEGYDVVFLDTAGRLQLDEELMQEVADVSEGIWCCPWVSI